MKPKLILPTRAAQLALLLCAAVTLPNLRAQVGTFSIEYRLADPSLTLTDSSISPSPSGLGWHVTGTYDNEGGDRFSWIMKLNQGGGVDWSFVVTEPLPRSFLTLDAADKLIIRRYHADENKTEITKIDPFNPASPVYALEIGGTSVLP